MVANVFVRHMITPLRFQILQLRHAQRTIHSTATLQKKKGKHAIDDFFSDDTFVRDEPMIKDSSSSVFSAKAPSVQPSSVQLAEEKTKGRKLPPAVRLERFNNLLSFMEPRIGKKPTLQLPLIRKRSWLALLDLAANKDQLQKIIDLFPKYMGAKGEFPATFAEAFTRRSHQLSCPELALTVFGNFAKYNLSLTPTAGRWLIHSLHIQHPISQTFLAASYFPAYNLPPISEDLASAVMIAAACYGDKNKTSEVVNVAEALIPHIRKMWTEEQTKLGSARTLEEARLNTWIAWALRRINRAISREEKEPIVPPELVPVRIKVGVPSLTPHLNAQA